MESKSINTFPFPKSACRRSWRRPATGVESSRRYEMAIIDPCRPIVIITLRGCKGEWLGQRAPCQCQTTLPQVICDYVGQTPMAKGYGTLPTYHVRPRASTPNL